MVVDRLAAATAQYSNQVEAKSTIANAASKSSSSVETKQAAEDTTSFTSSTTTVQALSKAALETSPARQAKVEALRQSVKSGQYDVDSARIAQSIVGPDV